MRYTDGAFAREGNNFRKNNELILYHNKNEKPLSFTPFSLACLGSFFIDLLILFFYFFISLWEGKLDCEIGFG